MEYQVIIIADTNDADYITSVNVIKEDKLETLKIIAHAISEFKPYNVKNKYHDYHHTFRHNWPTSELLRSDLGELSIKELYSTICDEDLTWFCGLTPYSEYGIHTINSITIQKVSDVIHLL